MEPRTTGFTSHSSDASDTRMEALGDDGWPALIGVGSVCRRSVLGENGLMRVIHLRAFCRRMLCSISFVGEAKKLGRGAKNPGAN